ncbi:CRISPR-associated protein, Cmr6 family [Acetomicrobium mobile DSM 13181]|uniref:CRISPR-associated protein, Cmr6 family n=2 Tax=Acetomicrobium TaxID=49894 RepID=I4BWU7_ACEMN|nr:type III-B CRISPR module RAMP protein Cmr6 [Acetomicrobium mobile]AFM21754.1 CRISPR-associated protein, Cmr6 family [Acetomicrobium mobile DSM 13181]SIN79694.1 CRISPR-associated protein, Cmr6 family [Acetomicrobium flavidum]
MTYPFDHLPDSLNLGLYWDKYFFLEPNNRRVFENHNRDERNLALELAKHLNSKLQRMTKEGDRNPFSILCNKLDYLINNLGSKMSKVCDLNFRLKGKLLVGSGNPSALEVGMTFSRNYGIPVIPNSAIKGCLAHYLKSNNHLVEYFKELFGEDIKGGENGESENIKGCLIFLDAIPISDLKFGVDIINSHFQPYYMNSDHPPNDWYNPVPVTYVTVCAGTFRFTILKDRTKSELPDTVFGELEKQLKQMLCKAGIGAKTNYGYGRFEEITNRN